MVFSFVFLINAHDVTLIYTLSTFTGLSVPKTVDLGI